MTKVITANWRCVDCGQQVSAGYPLRCRVYTDHETDTVEYVHSVRCFDCAGDNDNDIVDDGN